MVTVETIRDGVQFTPKAGAAFRRANTQVRAEFGRDIQVNSTYRDWDKQMRMFNAWNLYIAGRGPYPGHSQAAHPKYSRHTQGTALDSNDWVHPRIRQILADNGFIRNQLHVPNEQHHFEYIESEDKNRNSKPARPALVHAEEGEVDMLFLYVDNDGAGKPFWTLTNTRTGKRVDTHKQEQANGWATAWGPARKVNRQEFLNALDAIKKTA